MKLIVGLGNHGEKYKNTRHNVGFLVADQLNTILNGTGWKEEKKFRVLVSETKPLARLIKPQTFMNESGDAVARYANFYKFHISDIWVIHDDLDIPLGKYKIQLGQGPRLHNGINSVEKRLGSENFHRVRIGVENRPKALKLFGLQLRKRIPGEAYVLHDFTDTESVVLEKVIDKVVEEILSRLKDSN